MRLTHGEEMLLLVATQCLQSIILVGTEACLVCLCNLMSSMEHYDYLGCICNNDDYNNSKGDFYKLDQVEAIKQSVSPLQSSKDLGSCVR